MCTFNFHKLLIERKQVNLLFNIKFNFLFIHREIHTSINKSIRRLFILIYYIRTVVNVLIIIKISHFNLHYYNLLHELVDYYQINCRVSIISKSLINK